MDKDLDDMDYLLKTPAGYYFQKRIPKKLKPHFGTKVYIRKSLGTHDRSEAKLRCTRITLEVLASFAALSSRPGTATHQTLILDAALIVKLSALYKRSKLEWDDHRRNLVSSLRSVWGDGAGMRAHIADNNNKNLALAKSRMAALNYSSVGPKLASLLADNNISLIPPTDALLNTLKQSLLRTEIAYYTEASARDTGEYTPTEEIAPPVEMKVKQALTLPAIYDLWLEDDKRDAKTADTYKHHALEFNAFVKGIPAADITIALVRDYINDLASTLAYKTLQNRHKALKAMVNVAIRYRKLDFNVLDQYKLTKGLGTKTTPRRTYTPTELSQLMLNLHALPEQDQWLVLLGLTTGARIRELVQLHHKDIFKADGVWCLKLVNDEEAGQKVKNEKSHRRVPIHPELIKAGFVKFVQAGTGNGMVFNASTDNKYKDPSPAFGKRFSRFVDNVIGKDARAGLCFHSFRHNYTDMLKAHPMGGTDHAKALTGHSVAGVAAKYGSVFYPLTQLIPLVSELVIPVKLPVVR
jgi:integrase